MYNLSAFALFPPISDGVPFVASIAWTGQFKVGCTVSVDVTVHDASHARSTLRLGWAHPSNRSSISWIDSPTPLDAVPVITITRRDVGAVLVCEVLPVGSAGQEGQLMIAESQPVQADTFATSPVVTSQPASIPLAASTRSSLADEVPSARSYTADDTSTATQPQQVSDVVRSRGLQTREMQTPQIRLPQRTQQSDDRPSMIQSVSVHGDGVVGCLMRTHVSFPIHEMATANAM